jgi:nucleotide-binding universal stress UspA family protein
MPARTEEIIMFKHVLLPTDGSPVSDDAIRMGIQLAKSVNAKVTGFHVMPEFHIVTYKTEMLEDTRKEFARDSKAHAAHYLGAIEKAAKTAGVPCDTATATNDHPYEAIIKAAKRRKCDLIVMASHGRRGVRAILLGGETQKVLTNSHIPVLVCRHH